MAELFAQVQQVPEFFKKLVDEQSTRVQAFSDETARLESKLLESASQAVDESAKQVKAGLTQWANLAAQLRSQSLEATRKLVSVLTPRA